MKSVCVFCGSRSGRDPELARLAADLGKALAQQGLRLVYGGSRSGLMGVLADAALAAGGEVVGVIPHQLVHLELAHEGLTTLHAVDSMAARKTLLIELSDAFIALPGGYGTLDELCEVLTLAHLGFHHKPALLLDVNGYFDALRSFFDHALAQDFLSAGTRDLLLHSSDVTTALAMLRQRLASSRAA